MEHDFYLEDEEPAHSPTPSRYTWTVSQIQPDGREAEFTFDFYRLCEIIGLKHDAQKHALKKFVRAGQSVKPIEQDIDEGIDAARRWKEMVIEDREFNNRKKA